jgi:predicted AAA+ superfamily ATPase
LSNFAQYKNGDKMFTRVDYQKLLARLEEPRRFIQVLLGPRQVGKTTLTQQIIKQLPFPVHYISADAIGIAQQTWLEQQWEIGRVRARQNSKGALLVFDEIQKIADWSNIVKKMWDEDTRHKLPLRVLLLGSSALFLQQGLTESLAGRFETIPIMHWSYSEMREAFNFSLEQYIFFGGFPGAATLINDFARWMSYVHDTLIETTISKDILLMTPVKKPALLRQLFYLGCEYSGQILSYQKMLGQLQDAGNTTTLAHYLDLLGNIGILTGLQKFGRSKLSQRSSSPKLQVFNTAFISAINNINLEIALANRDYWGRLVENAVGAHLLNSAVGKNIKVLYWRESNAEVDFILQNDHKIIAFEVKSGKKTLALPGMQKFKEKYPKAKLLLVGEGGINLEEFLTTPVEFWF